MILLFRIDLCFVCVWALVTTCLALMWAPDRTEGNSKAGIGLRSAKRRLTTRLVKTEIRANALRLRRELDHELEECHPRSGAGCHE
jgi:hypothetical protein